MLRCKQKKFNSPILQIYFVALTFSKASQTLIFVVQRLPRIWPFSKLLSHSHHIESMVLAGNWDLNWQEATCVAALLSSSVIPVSQAVTALECSHQRKLFQSWHLMSETDSSHSSAQQQQHCDMARTVSTVHCPLFQLVYRKLPYHTRYRVHEPTEFSSVSPIPCTTESRRLRKERNIRARKQEKRRQKGTV